MSIDPTAQDLGSRVFTPDDQQAFARLSGDFNPMHVDAQAARRLLTGQPVVHGIHVLLNALERWHWSGAPSGWRVDCDFANPVSVGDRVSFRGEPGPEGQDLLQAEVAGLPCCRISLSHEIKPRPDSAPILEPTPMVVPHTALEHAPDSWVGQRQVIGTPTGSLQEAFPALSANIGERRVAALSLLSTYVGMICPGLHSVFASVSFEAGPDAPDLSFEVRRFDQRFRLFVIAFDGCIRGELKAFQRAPAQTQPATSSLLSLLSPAEFAGRHCWVIGGSRGLGELVAKLAAAGGSEVTLTYATGAADAARVVEDINTAGRGRAAMRRLDMSSPDWVDIVGQAPRPDAVFYFATPRIYRKRPGGFDAMLFDEFIEFYVRRFETLCSALDAASSDGEAVRVFYPSTVFIDERPRGMTEYAMAKAAAEVMITDLGRALAKVKVVCQRLPKLATDQTSSMFGASRNDNASVMLPVVREMLAPSPS